MNSPKPRDELWPAQWPKLITRTKQGRGQDAALTWPTRDAGRTRVRPPYIRARHRTALQSFTFVSFLTTSKYRPTSSRTRTRGAGSPAAPGPSHTVAYFIAFGGHRPPWDSSTRVADAAAPNTPRAAGNAPPAPPTRFRSTTTTTTYPDGCVPGTQFPRRHL